MEVNIYVKIKWIGSLKNGSGKAAGLVEYIDRNGEVHLKNIDEIKEATTKNELELKACISALRTLKKQCVINLYMKSQYVESAIKNGWIKEWEKNGWKRKNGQPLANVKGWQLLNLMLELHEINIQEYNAKYDEDLEEALSRKERARWQDIIDAMQ